MHVSKKQLQAITPSQITDWLRGLGFVATDVPARWEPYFAVFKSEGSLSEEGTEVSVPLDPSFADYARRVAETLEQASALLGQTQLTLIRDILASDQDVIRLRAMGPSLNGGHIPLSTGTRLVESARGLLLAAASSAVKPKAAYLGRQFEEARTFIDQTKLTPPEAGSFVISALAPVGRSPRDAESSSGAEIPFTRKATLMLATAIETAATAARSAAVHGDYSGLLNAADRGVSANLCEAIANFIDGDVVTSLEASVQWAGSRRAPETQAVKRTFSQDAAQALREAAGQIRATEPIEDFQLLGRVVRLDSGNPEAGGKVVVATTIDGRPRSVSLNLKADAYQLAIRSHENRALYLACEGELMARGRTVELESAREVELKELEVD